MQQGYRGSAVSIALLRGGVPVLGVVHALNAPDDEGDRFVWAEGCGPQTRNGQPIDHERWPTRLASTDIVLVSHAADRHPAGNLACVSLARFRAVPSIAYRLALVAAGEGVVAVSLNGPTSWDYAARDTDPSRSLSPGLAYRCVLDSHLRGRATRDAGKVNLELPILNGAVPERHADTPDRHGVAAKPPRRARSLGADKGSVRRVSSGGFCASSTVVASDS